MELSTIFNRDKNLLYCSNLSLFPKELFSLENIEDIFNNLTIENNDDYIVISYIDKIYLDNIPKFVSDKTIIKHIKIPINCESLDLTNMILNYISIYDSLIKLYNLKYIKMYLYYFDYIDAENSIYIQKITRMK